MILNYSCVIAIWWWFCFGLFCALKGSLSLNSICCALAVCGKLCFSYFVEIGDGWELFPQASHDGLEFIEAFWVAFALVFNDAGTEGYFGLELKHVLIFHPYFKAIFKAHPCTRNHLHRGIRCCRYLIKIVKHKRRKNVNNLAGLKTLFVYRYRRGGRIKGVKLKIQVVKIVELKNPSLLGSPKHLHTLCYASLSFSLSFFNFQLFRL